MFSEKLAESTNSAESAESATLAESSKLAESVVRQLAPGEVCVSTSAAAGGRGALFP